MVICGIGGFVLKFRLLQEYLASTHPTDLVIFGIKL
jgi:hypothetical protein